MADTERTIRQSVSIPTGIARRVRTLAKSRKTSANRVLVDLIEAGLQSKEAEKERFLSLVKRLTKSRDAAERQDRKSTRLNSSHLVISYAVFCLKKKTTVRAETSPAPASRSARPHSWSLMPGVPPASTHTPTLPISDHSPPDRTPKTQWSISPPW